MEPTAQLVSTPADSTLAVSGLSKRFGPLTVFDDLSLDFRQGHVTALLGPNGAGKTTLLKCLLGLVRPDDGSVVVLGAAVNGGGLYRHHIGFMPQFPNFPAHLTGWELAEMLDDLRSFEGEPDEELIDAFEIRSEMDKSFRTLSGGTRQKLNAALAFRYRAPVMILDEPTAGLDPVAAIALKEKIRASREAGTTLVVTSHNLGELEALADDVVFLLDGRAHFSGTLEELLTNTDGTDLEEAIAELMLRRNAQVTDHPPPAPGQADLRLDIGVA